MQEPAGDVEQVPVGPRELFVFAAATGVPGTPHPSGASRVVRAACSFLLWAVIASTCGLLAAALLPVYAGYHQVIIYGGSMGAALPLGSVAVTRTIGASEVRVGDVIAVGGGAAGPPVIHRVIELEATDAGPRVVTRGDANAGADPTRRVLQGRGDRVVYVIPMLGYLVHYSRTMPGSGILAATIGVAFASFAVRDLRRRVAGPGGGPSPLPLSLAGQRRLLARRAAARRNRAAVVLLGVGFLGSSVVAPVADAAFVDTASVGSNLFSADTMDAPTGVGASVSGLLVTLSWTASSDTYASGHRVFRSASAGGAYTQIAEVSPRTTASYVDAPGAGTWYYVVRSYFQNWESVDSGEVSATPSSGITFRAASSGSSTDSSTALVISKPAGTVANDVMIALVTVEPETATVTPPAGWTLVRRTNNAAADPSAMASYYKVAGGGEPASYTWTFGSAEEKAGGIMSFSGVNTGAPVHVSNGQTTASSLSHATPSVTTTLANTMLVTAHGMTSSSTWTPPAGMTEAFDRASKATPSGSGVSIVGSYAAQAGAGATGAKTATANSNNDAGHGMILALSP